MVNDREFGELFAQTKANANAIAANTRNISWLYKTAITTLIGLVIGIFVNVYVVTTITKQDKRIDRDLEKKERANSLQTKCKLTYYESKEWTSRTFRGL